MKATSTLKTIGGALKRAARTIGIATAAASSRFMGRETESGRRGRGKISESLVFRLPSSVYRLPSAASAFASDGRPSLITPP